MWAPLRNGESASLLHGAATQVRDGHDAAGGGAAPHGVDRVAPYRPAPLAHLLLIRLLQQVPKHRHSPRARRLSRGVGGDGGHGAGLQRVAYTGPVARRRLRGVHRGPPGELITWIRRTPHALHAPRITPRLLASPPEHSHHIPLLLPPATRTHRHTSPYYPSPDTSRAFPLVYSPDTSIPQYITPHPTHRHTSINLPTPLSHLTLLTRFSHHPAPFTCHTSHHNTSHFKTSHRIPRTVTRHDLTRLPSLPSPVQWIHKAGAQTSFGGPIAHGFLSLSLLPALLEGVLPPQPWAEGGRAWRYCSPRDRLPFDSGNEGSERVLTTWRALGLAILPTTS